MTWRGVFSGALALIALQAVLDSRASSTRVGEMLTGVGDLVRRAMDPSVAAIPDLRGTPDDDDAKPSSTTPSGLKSTRLTPPRNPT